MQKFSLKSPTQGNPEALKRTIDSLEGIIDEVIVGDVIIFPEDRQTILSYYKVDCPVNIIKFPFEFIFKNGFSAILNYCASKAKNNLIIYLNVGETLISDKNELLNRVSASYNSYYITHPVETHHWYRVYDRREVQWNGIIHEEIHGNLRPCSVPLFMFDDSPKDKENEWYGLVMNSVKELVYWNQYVKLIDQPHLAEGTHSGWLDFSRDGFHSFIDRLHQKGDMYDAFLLGDYNLFMKSIEKTK